jgi:hypothetical protein
VEASERAAPGAQSVARMSYDGEFGLFSPSQGVNRAGWIKNKESLTRARRQPFFRPGTVGWVSDRGEGRGALDRVIKLSLRRPCGENRWQSKPLPSSRSSSSMFG